MSISLYVVLRAGRGQFGNLEGVSIAYFTLYSSCFFISSYNFNFTDIL